MPVSASLEPLTIPTYPVGAPEKNPVFFEKRVYQGSCGKVYPVPFIDKVFDEPVDVTYQSARLENEFVRLVMLPEIGGRIFLGQDKTNDDYDFFYRQDVIKPALVGLAGPWISGGVEFNWPQHHRPGTFLPADVFIEEEPDGARTVWLSEHDPLDRLKGMHGIRLRPGSSLIELRARLYNRTPVTCTFLWWANVAAMVHDQYQSFFPPDVHYVADHAVRAQSSFPEALNDYYGVPYHQHPGANDLSWCRNIPVPTSYMVCQTDFGFFGGYDHKANGGFVHVADPHVSPGKKQWTWGNHDFGWAWDRELTDPSASSERAAPYVELMAGVYTDNQPDFSYLHPYETKTFSQFWWPIQDIGPVQQANQHAALHLTIADDRTIHLGLCVSSAFTGELSVTRGASILLAANLSLNPGEAWQNTSHTFPGESPTELLATLTSSTGETILTYRPPDLSTLTRNRPEATEPPPPADIPSTDQLYLTGEHLEQYRHPTRDPELYWNEALARDPDDTRCNIAIGRRLLRRGLLDQAAIRFETAIARLTHRHPNPVTGEAHYHLGLTLFLKWRRHPAVGRPCGILPQSSPLFQQSHSHLSKSTWSYEWRSPAHYLLACLDSQQLNFSSALAHLDASLATNRDHNKAKILTAIIHRHKGDTDQSRTILTDLLTLDPLDHWARHELALCTVAHASRLCPETTVAHASRLCPETHDPQGRTSKDCTLLSDFLTHTRNDAQTILDLVFDYADAGFTDDAIALLELHHANPVTPVAVPNPAERTPMTHYALAWLGRADRSGPPTCPPQAESSAQRAATPYLQSARTQSPDRFFPSRLHEQIILEWALSQPGPDSVAAYALGNYYYDLKRHHDAIEVWETSKSQTSNSKSQIPQLHRNLAIAHWNTSRDATRARAEYQTALTLDPADPRLISEFDQLRQKLNDPLADRLAFLEDQRKLVLQRDDASVSLATLYNLLERPQDALDLLLSRRFHPWEGGEGAVLRQYTTARILLGRAALESDDPTTAHEHFSHAMDTPDSLGEKYHLLQAKADVNYWIGRSLRALGREDEAITAFESSATESGDFSEMAVTEHSPLSYYRGLSLRELGRDDDARALFDDLLHFGKAGLQQTATIDYFATSLPNLLVFEEDLQSRRDAEHHLLIALAHHGLNDPAQARHHLAQTLAFTHTDQRAADLEHELLRPMTGTA